MRPGVRATVTLADASARPTASCAWSARSVDATTRLGKVRISLPVRPTSAPAATPAPASSTCRAPSLSVPETAVRYDANGASVMVVGADDQVTQVPVRTGDRGGGYVELLVRPAAGLGGGGEGSGAVPARRSRDP